MYFIYWNDSYIPIFYINNERQKNSPRIYNKWNFVSKLNTVQWNVIRELCSFFIFPFLSWIVAELLGFVM